MEVLPLLLVISGLHVVCGNYDVFLPTTTMCDLSSDLCGRIPNFSIIRHGQRAEVSIMLLMSLPAIPARVEKVTFAWQRTTAQQVTYNVSITSGDHSAMSPPTFRNAPMTGNLPSNLTYVDLLFHCTGSAETTVIFTINACFQENSPSSRMCTKATLTKACAFQERRCTIQCLNNGKCLAKYKKDKCICPKGFRGRRCERRNRFSWTPLKRCSIHCSKKGTLLCLAHKKRCVCKNGFKGAFCQHKKKAFSPCKGFCNNGGVCNVTTRTCNCPQNFIGPFCHKKIAFEPPEEQSDRSELRVDSGQDVHLPCVDRDIQHRSFAWYFMDGETYQQPLGTTDHITISTNGDLLIRKTTTADTGEYVCKAVTITNVQWTQTTHVIVHAAKLEGQGSGGGDQEDDDSEA